MTAILAPDNLAKASSDASESIESITLRSLEESLHALLEQPQAHDPKEVQRILRDAIRRLDTLFGELVQSMKHVNDVKWYLLSMIVAMRELHSAGYETMRSVRSSNKWTEVFEWALSEVAGDHLLDRGHVEELLESHPSKSPSKHEEVIWWITHLSNTLIDGVDRFGESLKIQRGVLPSLRTAGLNSRADALESILPHLEALHAAIVHERNARRRLESLAP